MARSKYRFSKETHARRLKEGRGQGDGSLYQPYIYVQDLSSLGQSNRDFGSTTGRQHDLFSKLEHRVYLVFDESKLYDIKEQYPHSLEISVEIARQCGIRHPTARWTKELVPVTTDLLLTVPLPIGSKRVGRAVKYCRDFTNWRVIEKLELERRCCQQANIEWSIITERDVDFVFIQNLLRVYKVRDITSLYPLSPHQVAVGSKALTNAVLAEDSPLCDIALSCDQLLGFPRGTCLRLTRYLIASRQWRVNLSAPIVTTAPLRLLHVSLSVD